MNSPLQDLLQSIFLKTEVFGVLQTSRALDTDTGWQ